MKKQISKRKFKKMLENRRKIIEKHFIDVLYDKSIPDNEKLKVVTERLHKKGYCLQANNSHIQLTEIKIKGNTVERD